MKKLMSFVVVAILALTVPAFGKDKHSMKGTVVGFENVEISEDMVIDLQNKGIVVDPHGCNAQVVVCVSRGRTRNLGRLNEYAQGYNQSYASRANSGPNGGSYRNNNYGTGASYGFSGDELQTSIIVELRTEAGTTLEAIVTNLAFPGTTSSGGQYYGSENRSSNGNGLTGFRSRSNGAAWSGSSNATRTIPVDQVLQHSVDAAIAKVLGIGGFWTRIDNRIKIKRNNNMEADLDRAFHRNGN